MVRVLHCSVLLCLLGKDYEDPNSELLRLTLKLSSMGANEAIQS